MSTRDKIKARFMEYVNLQPTEKGCLEWIGAIYPSGYGSFNLFGQGTSAHRVAYALAHNLPFELDGVLDKKDRQKAVVRHKCDNRRCVNPEHLEVGTQKDNIADAVARERHVRGEKVGNSKLTEDDVRAIKAEWLAAQKPGQRTPRGSSKAICEKYEISRTMLAYIVKGTWWKHTA